MFSRHCHPGAIAGYLAIFLLLNQAVNQNTITGHVPNQGIQQVRNCTITIETMADKGTQMSPMAVHVMAQCVGPIP